MRAKFLRKEKSKYWGYDYYLECMDCGKEYTSKRLDDRTSPYCGACWRKHSLERKKIREKQKKQAEINEVLDKIRAEITNIPITDTDGHNNNWYREPQAIINDVLQIIDKYRGD